MSQNRSMSGGYTHGRRSGLRQPRACCTVATAYAQQAQQTPVVRPCRVLNIKSALDVVYANLDMRTFGVTDTVDIMQGHPRLVESIIDDRQRPFAMVLRRITG